jgi:hypothetical protein
MSVKWTISCHCGKARQQVIPKSSTPPGIVDLCHCNICRYTTGQLFASYLAIERPESLEDLRSYQASTSSARYFCATCGCHVFQSDTTTSNDDWSVATGVITDTPIDDTASRPEWRHLHTEETLDGGLSICLGAAMASGGVATEEKVLQGSCHCGNVSFHLTRPDESSLLPVSGFADLIYPYASTPKEQVSNPGDVKWWLRANKTKYLAGTCACRSCRLISGFEVQSWTFVPRGNIFFQVPSEDKPLPLDFSALWDAGVLCRYDSSPAVFREFCPRCGATVFWHDRHRPELMDVSIGLLRGTQGARAEAWLDWWTQRTSFAEEVRVDRSGWVADTAEALIEDLETGLKSWGGNH